MAYVICEPCNKDALCVEECPVDCIEEGEDMMYINPDECIDCGLCQQVCPENAIFPAEEVPEQWQEYTQKNADFFANR
jgi:ferredoxin